MTTDNEQANREQVAKLIRLLGSDFEGEAVTALAKLRRLLPKRGLGFNDVGQWIQSPAKVVYRTAPPPAQPDTRSLEDRILALERQREEALRALRVAQARADEAEDQAGQLVSELVAARHQAGAAAKPARSPKIKPRGRWRGYVLAALVGVAATVAARAYIPSAGATGTDAGQALLSRAALLFTPAKAHAAVAGRSAFLYPAPTNQQAAVALLPPTTELEVLAEDVPAGGVPGGWVKVRARTDQGTTVGYVERRRLGQATEVAVRRVPG
ncbi:MULTISPECIES: hypothetical protein [Nitrospirillum]|uniref:SH3 domain-containing protein n=1 Tax=Nitrospirillum amazonense TaxID=28077 RepID=A0A560FQN6_9PROT|nr:hypothetical protein [Nitrospirillum amazonense]MEC4594957.1 hypothetical protein [Nitrospirillum amazonense]TWB23924.1 hypothetical protein FBZ88_11396 [Nitrospirillum amazonense]